jgi:hypothetical protein
MQHLQDLLHRTSNQSRLPYSSHSHPTHLNTQCFTHALQHLWQQMQGGIRCSENQNTSRNKPTATKRIPQQTNSCLAHCAAQCTAQVPMHTRTFTSDAIQLMKHSAVLPDADVTMHSRHIPRHQAAPASWQQLHLATASERGHTCSKTVLQEGLIINPAPAAGPRGAREQTHQHKLQRKKRP